MTLSLGPPPGPFQPTSRAGPCHRPWEMVLSERCFLAVGLYVPLKCLELDIIIVIINIILIII